MNMTRYNHIGDLVRERESLRNEYAERAKSAMESGQHLKHFATFGDDFFRHTAEGQRILSQIAKIDDKIARLQDNPAVLELFPAWVEDRLRDVFGIDGLTKLEVIDTPHPDYTILDSSPRPSFDVPYDGEITPSPTPSRYVIEFADFAVPDSRTGYVYRLSAHYRPETNTLYHKPIR